MRCLWVSGDVPHPARYGKTLYSAGLSEALAEHGVEVVGVGLEPSDDASPTSATWRPVAGVRRRRAESVVSRLPSMSFGTTVLRDAVSRCLAGEQWDVVVVDHLETAWVADVVPRPGPPIVYVAHNHEATVRREVAQDAHGLPSRVAWRFDAEKARRLERRVLSHASLVVAITEIDATRFAHDAPDVSRLVLTPGYDRVPAAPRLIDDNTPRQVTLVTSLDWHVKRANLWRFVAEADPVFTAAGVRCNIAGEAPEGFARRIEASSKATAMLGRVDALDQLLAETRIGIVAEPLGGGFKLKVLDYVFNRVPIASTAGSLAGLPLAPGSDLLEFADARALARGVVDVIDDYERLNELQQRAFARCNGAFEWSDRGRQLADALHALRSRT